MTVATEQLPFVVVALLRTAPEEHARFTAFEGKVSRLMARYGGRIERRIAVTGRAGPAGPANEIHVVTFPDEEAFERYSADPDVAALAEERRLLVQSTVLYMGFDAPLFDAAPATAIPSAPSGAPDPVSGRPRRSRVGSGASWEEAFAYSRAVRVGDAVYVSGTVATSEGGEVVGTTVFDQTRYVFDKIEHALNGVGARLSDVVRTRAFITDIAHIDEFGRAHREVFAGICPAATCVAVTGLVGAEYLVEVEVDAVVT